MCVLLRMLGRSWGVRISNELSCTAHTHCLQLFSLILMLYVLLLFIIIIIVHVGGREKKGDVRAGKEAPSIYRGQRTAFSLLSPTIWDLGIKLQFAWHFYPLSHLAGSNALYKGEIY